MGLTGLGWAWTGSNGLQWEDALSPQVENFCKATMIVDPPAGRDSYVKGGEYN